MTVTLTALQKQRRDTAANWTSNNPTLLAGELGYESDTGKWKVGDGSTAWTGLGYIPGTQLSAYPIVNADIASGAEIAVSKLADGAARQLLQTDAAGTGVEWTDNVDLPGTLDVTGAATFDNNVTVQGDLTVNGTQTIINTQTLDVEDKNIIIGNVGTPSDVTADGGGVTLKGSTDKTINWIDATDAWTSSERFSYPLGSAANPALTFTGDANTGIYSPGADQVAISTGGSGRLFVDASGNVGIKTASPAVDLQVIGNARIGSAGTSNWANFAIVGDASIQAASAILHFTNAAGSTRFAYINHTGTGGDFYLLNQEAGAMRFGTGNSERARIDSSGRLLVGTSSDASGGNANALLQCVASGPGTFVVGRSDGSTTSGDTLGNIFFRSYAGSVWETAASIQCVADATQGSGDKPGRLVFSTTSDGASSPTERMRLDSSGRLGLGTTSPAYLLDVIGDTNTSFSTRIRNNSTGGSAQAVQILSAAGRDVSYAVNYTGQFAVEQGSSVPTKYTDFDNHIWRSSAGSERARIDSSGRLLVGTSTSVNTFGVAPRLQIAGNESYQSNIAYRADAFAPFISVGHSRNATVGSQTILQSGDDFGTFAFVGSDGTGLIRGAQISAAVDGTPGTNDMPGRLVFSTTADGASSPTERMRITQAGDLNYGTGGGIVDPGTGTTDGLYYNNTDKQFVLSRNGGGSLIIRRRSSDGTAQGFYRDTTLVGTISVTTTATAYNTSSDYRLKENVVPLTGAADRLNQLQVHRFNFIADPDTTVDGFLAHEAQAVVPECVTGTKDEVDDDGNPVYQGIDQSKLVPLLTAALQEALAEIESLKARVTALEP